MDEKPTSICIRSKIWIDDGTGEVLFGLGRVRILEAIQRTGSILAAARDLGMSYRAVWGRIRASEDRLGRKLLVRNIGGKKGGGSSLTPFAQELIADFRDIHRQVMDHSDELFDREIAPLLGECEPSPSDESKSDNPDGVRDKPTGPKTR
jgi:molybdate transport system regulatory protein